MRTDTNVTEAKLTQGNTLLKMSMCSVQAQGSQWKKAKTQVHAQQNYELGKKK